MDWTDCSVIEVVAGRMSGAPVLRGSRVRPEDLTTNLEQGAEWMAGAFGLRIEDVRVVLGCHAEHQEDMPIEYISPERIAALGADIDWSGCPGVGRTPGRVGGAPVIWETRVRPVDLIAHRGVGVEELAETYALPVDTVRSVFGYFDQRTRQLAPAV